jgi:hypothetical protein
MVQDLSTGTSSPLHYDYESKDIGKDVKESGYGLLLSFMYVGHTFATQLG